MGRSGSVELFISNFATAPRDQGLSPRGGKMNYIIQILLLRKHLYDVSTAGGLGTSSW